MIDYQLIGEAVKYYEALGFKPIEVPWTASEEFMMITAPPNGVVTSSIGLLVGSAEQSILEHVAKSGFKGKFLAVTPCFRDESVDEFHQKYFMKVELFQNDKVTEKNLQSMIYDAECFFANQYVCVKNIPVGPQAFDIVGTQTGIELGSYGIRTHELTGPWIYGTGVAEPRFSKVSSMERR